MARPSGLAMSSVTGFLAAIAREVVRGVGRVAAFPVLEEGRAPLARVVAAARALHLDHFGAEVGEELRAPGTGEDAGEIEDANAVENRRQAKDYSGNAQGETPHGPKVAAVHRVARGARACATHRTRDRIPRCLARGVLPHCGPRGNRSLRRGRGMGPHGGRVRRVRRCRRCGRSGAGMPVPPEGRHRCGHAFVYRQRGRLRRGETISGLGVRRHRLLRPAATARRLPSGHHARAAHVFRRWKLSLFVGRDGPRESTRAGPG
jgi:hypothetical protein